MKNFDKRLSLKIDAALRRVERNRGLRRLYWRLVLAYREYKAMG